MQSVGGCDVNAIIETHNQPVSENKDRRCGPGKAMIQHHAQYDGLQNTFLIAAILDVVTEKSQKKQVISGMQRCVGCLTPFCMFIICGSRMNVVAASMRCVSQIRDPSNGEFFCVRVFFLFFFFPIFYSNGMNASPGSQA
jgi:hypothetical protein